MIKTWILSLCFLSPFFVHNSSALPWDGKRITHLQFGSLKTLYYPGTPMPTEPNLDELENVRDFLSGDPTEETDFLVKTYGPNHPMIALALRDTDGDGQTDYRIDDATTDLEEGYGGRFFENDLDVDNDGVPNIYDPNPYTDGDELPASHSLPEHLDWINKNETNQRAETQHHIFQDFGVVLIDRSRAFDRRYSQIVDTALRWVFADAFEKGQMDGLQAIVMDDDNAIEGGDSYGMYESVNQTLYLFDNKLKDLSPLGILLVVIHELGHAYQASMNLPFSHQELASNIFSERPFRSFMERFEWTSVEKAADDEDYKKLFKNVATLYSSTNTFDFLYRGKLATDWQKEISSLKGNALIQFLKANKLVNKYSLQDAYEWFSENMVAYVIGNLNDRISVRFEGREKTRRLAALKRILDKAYGDDPYLFKNLESFSPFYRFLNLEFPISEDFLDGLIADDFLAIDQTSPELGSPR